MAAGYPDGHYIGCGRGREGAGLPGRLVPAGWTGGRRGGGRRRGRRARGQQTLIGHSGGGRAEQQALISGSGHGRGAEGGGCLGLVLAGWTGGRRRRRREGRRERWAPGRCGRLGRPPGRPVAARADGRRAELPGRSRRRADLTRALGCRDARPPALRLLAAGLGGGPGMKKFTVRRFFSVYLRKSRSELSLSRLEVNALASERAGTQSPPRPGGGCGSWGRP